MIGEKAIKAFGMRVAEACDNVASDLVEARGDSLQPLQADRDARTLRIIAAVVRRVASDE